MRSDSRPQTGAKKNCIAENDAISRPSVRLPTVGCRSARAQNQRKQLDLVQALNRQHEKAFGEDEFLDGRIQAMETAYRMQFEAMDVFDLRKEPAHVREAYGETPFANGCLLARRLVERGVRTVHVFYGPGQPWDDHAKIQSNLTKRCPDMDKASAAPQTRS